MSRSGSPDDGDAAVAGADLRVATGQGDVHGPRGALHAAHLVDGEGGTHRVHAEVGGENGAQAFVGKAVDLQVELLHGPVEQGVADGSAHEIRAAAFGCEGSRRGG